MTKTGQWLADWMAEDGAIDRLPEGWDDPHALVQKIEAEARADLLAQIEAMSGDAADLTDLMDEAAALRTALAHVLVRTHDSGCGTCDAARALLTADHELPSRAAIRSAAPVEPVTDRLVSVGGAE